MNERIQELAYEAEDYADSIVDAGGEFHTAYTRKLAELIVRECMEVVNKRFMGDLNREDQEVRRCVEDIKNHFALNNE